MSTLRGNWEILLLVFVRMCIVKFCPKILKICGTKLISTAYAKMMSIRKRCLNNTH